jgi:hypothetical protein
VNGGRLDDPTAKSDLVAILTRPPSHVTRDARQDRHRQERTLSRSLVAFPAVPLTSSRESPFRTRIHCMYLLRSYCTRETLFMKLSWFPPEHTSKGSRLSPGTLSIRRPSCIIVQAHAFFLPELARSHRHQYRARLWKCLVFLLDVFLLRALAKYCSLDGRQKLVSKSSFPRSSEISTWNCLFVGSASLALAGLSRFSCLASSHGWLTDLQPELGDGARTDHSRAVLLSARERDTIVSRCPP